MANAPQGGHSTEMEQRHGVRYGIKAFRLSFASLLSPDKSITGQVPQKSLACTCEPMFPKLMKVRSRLCICATRHTSAVLNGMNQLPEPATLRISDAHLAKFVV